MKRKGCSHGKTFDERCIDCELVLAREGLRWSQEGVERYTQQIARLEAEKCANITQTGQDKDRCR